MQEMIVRGLSEPKQASRQSIARRLKLSPKLLEDERFIDPAREAELLLPQLQVSQQLLIEAQAEKAGQAADKVRRQSLLSTIYDQVASWLAWVKLKFRGNRRARQRLTREGKRALEQLRYLSLLCDATEARTPDEVLSSESAFGTAYYEIMNLSANLLRMSQQEQEHHIRHYQRHLSAILRATD